MIEKKFIHFAHYTSIADKKFSAGKDNTTYTIGGVDGEVFEGTPDISYQSIVFIRDRKYIITHGKLYNASGLAEGLSTPISINNTDFDGKSDIITDIWGTSRQILISDSQEKNVGEAISVDGSKNIILPLPQSLDVNVTNDSEGNNIKDTYSTKTELVEAMDSLSTFLVFSGDTDDNPTLDNYPASEWTTQEDRESHAGDYYVTTTGRIFQFYEDSNSGWIWKELTDYYLYECQQSLDQIKSKFDFTGKWDQIQTSVEKGNIIINGVEIVGGVELGYLDVLCCNQNLTYMLSEDETIYLPYIYEGGNSCRTLTSYSSGIPHNITFSELSKIVGKNIILCNSSSSSGTITLEKGKGVDSNTSVTIQPGEVCILKFVATSLSDNLYFYWECTKANKNFDWE